jgi:hypothetical protein
MYHSNSAFRIDVLLGMHPLYKFYPELAAWKLIRAEIHEIRAG